MPSPRNSQPKRNTARLKDRDDELLVDPDAEHYDDSLDVEAWERMDRLRRLQSVTAPRRLL